MAVKGWTPCARTAVAHCRPTPPGVDADLQPRLAEDFPLQLAVFAMEGGPLQALGLQLFGEGGVIQLAQRLQRGSVIGVVEAQLEARLLPVVQQHAVMPVFPQAYAEAMQRAAVICRLQRLPHVVADMLDGQVGQLPAVLDQPKHGQQGCGRLLGRLLDAFQGGVLRGRAGCLAMGTRGQAGEAEGQGKDTGEEGMGNGGAAAAPQAAAERRTQGWHIAGADTFTQTLPALPRGRSQIAQ